MIGGKVKGKVDLGIFIPSSFRNYERLESILNKKVEHIRSVSTTSSNWKFVADWATQEGIPHKVYPLNSKMNLVEAANLIANETNKICIVDNEMSESASKLCKLFTSKGVDFNKLVIQDELTLHDSAFSILDELNQAYKKLDERFVTLDKILDIDILKRAHSLFEKATIKKDSGVANQNPEDEKKTKEAKKKVAKKNAKKSTSKKGDK